MVTTIADEFGPFTAYSFTKEQVAAYGGNIDALMVKTMTNREWNQGREMPTTMTVPDDNPNNPWGVKTVTSRLPDFVPAPSPAVAVVGRLNAGCAVCKHAVMVGPKHLDVTSYGGVPGCLNCHECEVHQTASVTKGAM